MTLSRFGPPIAISGSVIATIGVIVNNVQLDHVTAMRIWVASNLLLMIWAYGFTRKWWSNSLSGMALTSMYAVMLVTGVWGLMQC